MFQFINFLICLIIFIPAIIIIATQRGKKPYKVKEDILFIEKILLKVIFLIFYILLFLYELLKEDSEEEIINIIFLVKIIFLNNYIILLFMNNFFLCLEDYFTYMNPLHYFNSLFHKLKYNFLYEFISICLIICFTTFIITDITLEDNIFNTFHKNFCIIIFNNFTNNINNINNITNNINNINNTTNNTTNDTTNDTTNANSFSKINEESPFIIFDSIILLLGLAINIIIIILYIVLKYRIKKIIFKTREKLFKVLNRKIISSSLYLIFIIFNIILFYFEKENIFYDILRIFNSYIFLCVYSLDSYLEFKTYSTSKFAQYKLKYTIVDSIGSFFNRNQKEDRPTNAFLDSMLQDVSNNNIKSMVDDEEDDDNSLLMPINTNDIELVLIYRNNIFIEDYFFYYYDYIMNVTLSGLYLIYKKKEFSASYANAKQLNKEMNITESTIFGGGEKYSNTYTSNTLKKIDIADDDDNLTYKTNSCSIKDEYVFIRDSLRNDFGHSEEIFTNTINDYSYDNLTIKITPFFTSKCVSNLIEKNYTTKMISDSLRSHLNIHNNNNSKIDKNNISSENNLNIPYHSILSCNAKEEYFLHLKNLIIRTYDKQLTFDIFETNDEDINKNNSNKKIALMLDAYFNYIKGVNVSGTFLPIIIGIFKIKINSFKTMLVYISCNSLIENSPLANYSYWQLVRFSPKNTDKIASSKYRHSVLIGDDLIFDRKYALPSVKEDNDSSYNKVELKNYFNFEGTIKHDINFLKEVGINNSDLLMMYFEYENTQKHEMVGAIKIKKVGDNKAEIINTDMPIFREEEETDDNININIRDFTKKQDSEVATIPTINNEKKSESLSNKFSSIINEKINEIKNVSEIKEGTKENNDDKKNELNNENKEEENNNNINNNLDIAQSYKSNNNLLNKNKSNFGSLNADFIDDGMFSFDDQAYMTKNRPVERHNILNYPEEIKINSYDGYFDAFNCICLFSFENIFELNSSCSCSKVNYNEFEKKIFNNFSDYTPRKHTFIQKSKKSSK